MWCIYSIVIHVIISVKGAALLNLVNLSAITVEATGDFVIAILQIIVSFIFIFKRININGLEH